MSAAADVERRLFEVLGAWAPEAEEPEAKLLFRVHSFQHARHAEWLGGVEVDGLDAVAAQVEDAARGPADTPARLTSVYGSVLPALVAAYAGAIGDALEAVVAEDEAAMQEAERLLAKLKGASGVASAPAKRSEST